MSDVSLWKKILQSILPETDIFEHEPMERHTTFRAGGKADLFAYVRTKDALRQVCLFLKQNGLPCLVVGKGSNVLVADSGYHGVLLCLTGDAFQKTELQNEPDGSSLLCAGAAVTLAELAHAACDHGIAGYVPLSGIPGTIGGALTMNAGAYGGEMKDVVVTVRALDLAEADVPEITLKAEDMRFGYRTSIAKQQPLLFLSAGFSTDRKEDPDVLKEQMRTLSETRRTKQPLEYPSAGSTFKRPAGAFAAKLIEDAGLKGLTVGGAQVSEKHAGFIINKGSATASDIIALMREVRRRVEEASGIRLEPEVILLGEDL